MSSVFLPPDQTRLVTICAHVDHGKTTLADNLIEANGIISERLAGTLRYLDSLEEEQRRGITMRASAIGLRHVYRPNKKEQAPTNVVVHLLDSPGHTDFSTEVSSSLQCCDGCLLVVDAVEGMCARTHQVVREAHNHQLVPILVINKVDRLCTSLCLTPTEAYLRLRSLIESVNAACASMLTSKQAEEEAPSTEDSGDEPTLEEQQWTFDPAKGNVLFGSALFGWGFTVPALARSLFRQKLLPLKPLLLKQYLFGDFKMKGDKVLKWKPDHSEEPLFATYGLAPIWDLYEGIAGASVASGAGSTLFADGRIGGGGSTAKSNKQTKIQASTPGMEEVLELLQSGATSNQPPPKNADELQQILTRTGATAEDGVLRCILRRYRPLSDSVLDTVYEICPSPKQASSEVRPRALAFSPPFPQEFLQIQQAAKECDISPEAPCIAHVCKFMSTDRSHIRDPQLSTGEADGENPKNVILGLARVLSGRLRTGDAYHVFGPKHGVEQKSLQRTIRLYLLMGSSFVLVNEVPAGHLCAVQNLEDVQLKTATLCDSPFGRPLQGFDRGIRPLVKVNVEAVVPADTALLERGLVKLSLADAAVEVTATAKGERLLACLGELHLEQSILDLKNVYCDKPDIELRVSDPYVEFGETTEWFEQETSDFGSFWENSVKSGPLRQTTIPPYNEEEGLESASRGRCRSILSGRVAAINLRAVPLKAGIHQYLREKKLADDMEDEVILLGKALGIRGTPAAVFDMLAGSLCSIDEGGNAMIESPNVRSGTTVVGVMSDKGEVYIPPKLTVGNVDADDEDDDNATTPTKDGIVEFEQLQSQMRQTGFGEQAEVDGTKPSGVLGIWKNQMKGSLVAGFQMAMRAGPVCEEPVRGVLVVLEGVEIAISTNEADGTVKCAKPMSGGMVVSSLRSGIRCALLTRPSRLMEQHLKLTLHSSLTGIGSLYTVLSKRRGKVVDDAMVDGTDLLMITATIPHAESFGLAPELFRQSSGEVTAPELVFSHWERLDQDPFWIPTSLEEREDFGEILQNGDVSTGMDNTALNYIRRVRERKGLLVDSSRTVVAAEKQRTMKR